jgi:Raf kinase inhibitor-like YbhB/YbcL family protein
MRQIMWFSIIGLVLICGCQQKGQNGSMDTGGRKMNMKVTSAAFEEGASIPKKFTSDGDNISPQIAWTGIPTDTKSIALICDDPDAPIGLFTHWVLFNLPADTKELSEGVQTQKTLPNGAKQGANDAGKIGYTGPCPPSGTHRYFFKVYALDTEVKLDPGIRVTQLQKAVQGHILAEGQLMGIYSRQR